MAAVNGNDELSRTYIAPIADVARARRRSRAGKSWGAHSITIGQIVNSPKANQIGSNWW